MELISLIVPESNIEYYTPLFTGIVINEYNPMEPNNNYLTSKANDYYNKVNE